MVILLDYAQRTESRIVLSGLVQEELLAHKIRQLEGQWDAYVRSAGLVRTFVPSTPVPPEKPDFEKIGNEQVATLRKKLRSPDILPVTEAQMREAVRRAVRRVPPCTERGEEIRDAILWAQVAEIVRKDKTGPVAFISANTRQFAAKDGSLLPVLAEEVRPSRLVYYPSLDAFAKQHATAIEFITREWLEARIPDDQVFQKAESRLERIARRAAGSRAGYVSEIIEEYWIELDDFYVYEMEDGTLRVQAYWTATLEVPGDDVDYGYGFNPVTGKHEFHHMFEYESESKEVEVVITVEAIVRDRNMESWDVIDAEDT
jgi:predicted DNA-binding protein